MFVFSLTPRKEPKEGCYPQGPLDRGMQTEDCRNRQSSVGFSNAGRRVELFDGLIKDAMTQDEKWNLKFQEVMGFIEGTSRLAGFRRLLGFNCSFSRSLREKNQKRGATPKAPYIGGCNRSSCRSYISVSSDHQRSGL